MSPSSTVAWWTVQRVLVATAADLLGPAAPTARIGIDETRVRSVRWLLGEIGWPHRPLDDLYSRVRPALSPGCGGGQQPGGWPVFTGKLTLTL